MGRRRLSGKAGGSIASAIGAHYQRNKRAYHAVGTDLLNASASVIQKAFKRRAGRRSRANSAGSTMSLDSFGTSMRRLPALGPAVRVSEWGKKVVMVRNIGSKMNARDRMMRMNYAPAVDRRESFATFEFDSPKQGIQFIDFCTREEMRNCFNLALASGIHVNTGTLSTANVTRDDTGAAMGNASGYNIDALGRGSFRAQEIDMWLENVWQQHQIQNSCSNTLEFTIEAWHPKYEWHTANQDQLTTFDGYHPDSLLNFVQQIAGTGGVAGVSAGLLADSGASGAQRQDPYRHGTNLNSLLAIRQYYKRLSKTKFVLKPGEQKDVMLKTSGCHRMNFEKWRMFLMYKPVSMYVTITCRASLVGHNLTTAVSHGSGAYMHSVRTGFTSRFGGWRCPKIVRELDAEVAGGILEANQQNINPETDGKQTYEET